MSFFTSYRFNFTAPTIVRFGKISDGSSNTIVFGR